MKFLTQVFIILFSFSSLQAASIEVLLIDFDNHNNPGSLPAPIVNALADATGTDVNLTTIVDTAADGTIASTLSGQSFDQVFFLDIGASHRTIAAADLAALANFHASKPAIIVDGTPHEVFMFSAIPVADQKQYMGNIINEFDRLGGGMWVGGDHSGFDHFANQVLGALNINPLNQNVGSISANVQNPLPSHPIYENVGGLAGKNISSLGEVPIGLQPSGIELQGILFSSNGLPMLSANFEPGVTPPLSGVPEPSSFFLLVFSLLVFKTIRKN